MDSNTVINEDDYKFFGKYRALVVDDEDPRDIGRVKVRIPGFYGETVEHDALPWAIPATSIYRSGGENLDEDKSVGLSLEELKTAFNATGTGGMFTVPSRGNHIWVWFDGGNHMHPVYFAMAPGEDDWLRQKEFIKQQITDKIEAIKAFKQEFVPEDGVNGVVGTDWGNGAFISARQGLSSTGLTHHGEGKGNAGQGENISGNAIESVGLNITENNDDNMESVNQRAQGSDFILDVKPLADFEEGNKEGYKFEELDVPEENGKNINRYVTSFTTVGGTSIIIDNRDGQENYYLIHKSYLENIDQNGSRKVFIGTEGEGNDAVRCTDELAVAGDKKIHVLGDFSTYVKGNVLTQCDKNVQIDVNDTCGLRVKKGDFDIILNGDEDTSRDEGSGRDNGKRTQYGDLNIDIQNGHMDLHVKKNVNIHVEDQCNLLVDGDMKATVQKSFHLNVKGDYNELIEGNKYTTVKGNVEERYRKYQKTYIDGDRFIEAKGDNDFTIGGQSQEKIGKGRQLYVGKDFEHKIGSKCHTEIGSNNSLIIRGNNDVSISKSSTVGISSKMSLTVGGDYLTKSGGSTHFTIGKDYYLKASGRIGMRSSSTVGIRAASDMGLQSSKFSAKVNSFQVSSAGNFNGDVTSNITNLNAYHQHTHRFSWYWGHYPGRGSSSTQPFGGSGRPGRGASVSVSTTSPTSASTVSPPAVQPDTAVNDGGGITIEPIRIKEAIGEPSNKTSTNKTKPANRRNLNRK